MDHRSSAESEAAAEPEVKAAPDSPAPPTSTGQRSLWPAVVVLTVVVVALALTLVVVRAQDGRPRAEVGEVFGVAFQQDPLPDRGQVLLPWARTQVGAGKARRELPELLGAEANLQAPDGGSFVEVQVGLEDDFAIPLTAVGRPYVEETEVVLRADGRDYSLTGPGGLVLDPNGPYQQGGSAWVAVEGEPTDLEVRVTVDGVTQVVDAADGSVDAGQAAGLADIPSAKDIRASPGTPCGEPRRRDDSGLTVDYRPGLECRVQLSLRTPYVDGLGWAEPGREFLVVHLVRPRRLSLVSGSGDARQGWDSELRFSARLGDAEPLTPAISVNDLNQGGLSLLDPDDPDQVVFDVAQGDPAADLTLEVLAAAQRGGPFAVERRQVRFEWTVAGGELS